MNSIQPWIDDSNCLGWISEGFFGGNGGRALQLHQQGFCLFRPRDSDWLSFVNNARQDLCCDNTSLFLRRLAIHSEISELLRVLYGRDPYASRIGSVHNSSSFGYETITQYSQSDPAGFVCGIWIALEDSINEDSALRIIPSTHCDATLNSRLSDRSTSASQNSGVEPSLLYPTRGNVILMHCNLLHSPPPVHKSQLMGWSPMLTFFFSGSRLIDPNKSRDKTKIFYCQATDLNSSRLRPNFNDRLQHLMGSRFQDSHPVQYKNISETTDIPLIDSTHFQSLREEGLFGPLNQVAQQLNDQGFGILQIQDSEWIRKINQVRQDLEPHVDLKSLSEGNLGPIRFQDAWLHHNLESVRTLACHPEILSALQVLYGRVPFPFQTLNFPNGTAQHFHSDAVHFHSLPHGFMCGVWVALENISPRSGPLVYFPGSHRLPYITASDFGLTTAQVLEASQPQQFFQKYWRRCKNEHEFPRCRFTAVKGDVLIWHANLLHGGSPVKDKSMTRWSQVTHYFFEGCRHTTPLFQTIDATTDGPHWRFPQPIKP